MSDREEDHVEQSDDWRERYESGDETAKELFRQVSHISLCLSYDLIDKIRWWEKETLKLPEDEIGKRLEHMSSFLDQLKTAYLTFSDTDL